MCSLLQESDVPTCRWCDEPLGGKAAKQFCNQRCRQAAWRIRQRHQVDRAAAHPLRMAYADPPYPGFAQRLYGRREVDLGRLIASLNDRYNGWALSTGAYALVDVLALCPREVRVCAWVKPIGVSGLTWGIHNAWEPVIVLPGRGVRPGKRDWLAAQPARRGGDLPGRKPLAFAAWLFGLLGLQPGDRFDDLFPGTGVMTRAWRELSRHGSSSAAAGDASPSAESDGRASGPSQAG